jgi:hypothetical protein
VTQPTLFDAPPAIPPRDPRVAPAAVARLSAQSAAVLERLRRGPATNTELAAITHRFGARLYDCRKAGYDIRITANDHATGLVTYALFEGGAA